MPFVILGVGGILASIVAINLPETANEQLPENIEEAEEFGKNQGRDLPFLIFCIL
jgi:hypothetical protein